MKRYAAYKSTGIPWIPEVPEHWEVRMLSQLAKEHYKSNKDVHNRNLLSLSYGRIINKDINRQTGLTPASYDTYQIVEDGNIVLRLTDLQNDQRSLRVGLCTQEGIITSAYLALEARESMHPPFLYLLLHVTDLMKVFYCMGNGLRQNLNWGELRKLLCILPPLSEQRAIVAYVERKAEQIECLKELRQTIISHAVTRGIRPYTRFRLTGIPWIPEVPEHWEVVPFGRHFTYGKGLPITKADLLLEGVAVISYGQIHSKDNTGTSISEGMVRRVSPSYITTNPQSLLEKDDFVFADTSEDLEGVGNCAFNDYRETLFAGYHTIIARPINLAYPIYYAYLFRSNYWKNSVQAIVNGIKVYSINRGILKRSFLLLPPLSEQRAIVAYIEKKTATVDRMINACREQTELMKAYKQRLISDAVTGRINVLPHD